jgi:CRP/FNR family transcriptional regulator
MVQLSPTSSAEPNLIPIDVSRRSADQLIPLITGAGLTSSSYPPGVELFHQGDTAKELFFLETGIAKLVYTEESGRELIADIRLSGSVLGLSAVIRNQSHHLTATTASRCRLIRLPAERFMELVRSDPALGITVQHILSDEVINQAARIAEIACLNARQRLENFIWRITQQTDAPPQNQSRLQLPLKQWEVAQFLAITPGYLCRLLSELEAEEVITRRNGWIFISTNHHLWHRE